MSLNTGSEYSKAYYNQRKRNKVDIKIEILTPELATFIFKNDSMEYKSLFGENMKYMTCTDGLDEKTMNYRFNTHFFTSWVLCFFRFDLRKPLFFG